MIKKGEIRAVINPKIIISKLKKLDAKRVRLYKGTDFYFDRKLFEKGYHFRVRKQTILNPKKEKQYFLNLKIHEPNFRKMNIYKTWNTQILDGDRLRHLLRQLGYKEIFVERWRDCEQFKINDLKVELFYLNDWNWLIEFEEIIQKSNKRVYDKLLDVAALLGISEENLTIVEPATYLFNKKFNLI